MGCILEISINAPAATSDSLFASATRLPHSIALRVGRNPEKPTSALITKDALDEAIINHLRRKHHLLIGEATAELIKKTVGTAHSDFDAETMEVRGRSLVHGAPAAITVCGAEIREAMSEVLGQITVAIRQTLESTPPELSGDIINRGIALAGGGALVRGLRKQLSEELEMEVTVPADPLAVVVQGAGKCLDHSEEFKDVWLS